MKEDHFPNDIRKGKPEKKKEAEWSSLMELIFHDTNHSTPHILTLEITSKNTTLLSYCTLLKGSVRYSCKKLH